MADLFAPNEQLYPAFADYLPQAPQPLAPGAPPPPIGRGNLVTAGLGAGLYGTLSQLGSAAEAGGKLFGADNFANEARDYAARQQAAAATYQRPDLEANPFSFKGILYNAMKVIPAVGGTIAAGIGAAAASPIEAPTAIAAGVGGLAAGVLGLGGNVQASEQANGPLTREQAGKAAALAVPEGILGAVMPGKLRAILESGSTGILKGAAVSGAYQGGVSAAQDILTQQMGDPNRSFADRAQDVVNAALSGGLTGAILGGSIHAIAKKPIQEVTNPKLDQSTAGLLEAPPIYAPAPMPEPEPEPNPIQSYPLEVLAARMKSIYPEVRDEAVQEYRRRTQGDQLALPAPSQAERIHEPSMAGPIELPDQTVPEAPPAPLALPKPADFVAGPPADIPSHPLPGASPEELIGAVRGAGTPDVAVKPGQEIVARNIENDQARQVQEQAQVQASVKFAPKDMRDDLSKAPDLATAQDIVKARIGERTDDSPPIKGSLLKVAQTLGVVDDKGNVIPKAAAVAETPPASAGVPRDAISDKHQGRWDALDKVQQTIAGDPNSDLQHLLPNIEAAKAALQNPAPGDVSKANALIRKAQTAIEGDKAQQDIAAAGGTTRTPRIPVAEPKPTDVAPDGTPPTKSAQDFVTRMQAAKQAKLAAYQEAQAAKAKAPATQAEAKAAPVQPDRDPLAGVKAQIDEARKSLGALMDQGKVIQDVRAQTITNAPKDLTRAASTDKGVVDLHTERLNNAFQQAVTGQSDRLQQIEQAVKTSDPKLLSNIEDTHFGSELWDNQYDNVDTNTQRLIGAHDENEQRIIDALRRVYPKDTPLVAASSPRTQSDVDLSHILANGGSAHDVLRYIQERGSSPDAQLLAASLMRTTGDMPMRFADANRFKFDNDRVLRPDTMVKGSYNPALNRVNIYDGSGIEQTMLHEGVHAAMQRALSGRSQVAAEGERLYRVIKDRSPNNDAYGLTNKHEFFAEAFTNPQFKDFLRSQTVSTGSRIGDMWQSVKNAAFRVLGMPERARTMFDQVMDTGSRVMKENAAAPAGANVETPRLFGSPKDQDEKLRVASAGLEVPKQRGLSMLRDEAAGKAFDLGVGARKTIYSWADTGFIGELNEKNAPSIKVHADLIRTRENREGLNNKMLKVGLDQAEALPEEGKKLTNQLAAGLNEGLDGRQGWETQTEAHAAKNSGDLAKDYAVLKRAYEHLKGIPGGAEAYDTLIKGNQAALVGLHALKLDDMVRGDKIFSVAKIAGFENDLGNDYQFEGAKLAMHDSPALSRTYFMAELQKRLDGVKIYANTVNGEIAKLDPGKVPDKGALTDKAYKEALAEHTAAVSDFTAKKQDLLGQIAPLVSLAKASQDALDNVRKDTANFHQGREDGSHFVAARLATDKDGTTKADVAQNLYQRLADAGFKNVTLQQHAENKNIYVRVDTPANFRRMTEVFNKAYVEGLLDKDTGVKAGDATNPDVLGHIAPLWMEKVLSTLRDNAPELPADATDKDKIAYKLAQDKSIADASRQMLSMLPDSSIKKVLAHRQGGQGFDADMLNSYRQRAIATSRLMANISTARNISDSITGMRNDVIAANENMKLTPNQKLSVSAAVNEVLLREAQRSVSVPSSFVSGLRLWTHNLEVGSSPGYVATLFLQNFTTSLPRLGSVVGYGNALGAMARALPITTKITRAAMLSKDAATYGLRNADLEAAGLSKTDIDFWMHHAAMGDTTYGSYTHGIRGDEGDSKFGKIGMMAGAMGLHAEMMPRNLMMFAARDAWRGVEKDGDLHDFVSRMIRKSQMDWTTSLNSRQQGRMGTFGSASPLIFQFMSWQIKFTQTLYKEAADAFGKNPEDARLARRFLAGHLAAVTALAGTMGLPMAGVMATVYDRLKDALMGEDNNDIQAAYRNFLSDTFGHAAGELIARGLPRALGVDLTHEAGEEKLVPGSSALELLAEKRKAADAEKDYLKLMGGSALGVGANFVMGLRDITNQDYLQGMQKILPDLPRDMVEAGQLALRGYVNKSGTPLPNLTPSAHDVLLEAIGLEPSQLAEYNETKKVAMGEKNMASLRSQNISEHLALAEQRHDPANFQYWMGQSQAYQQEHVGEMSPMMNFNRYITEQMQQGAMAKAMGVPLGVRPRDIVGRGMVRFGNLPSQ